MEIISLVNFIKTNYPDKAMDISESLELLFDSFDSALTAIKDSSGQAFEKKEYDRVKELVDVAGNISTIQDRIKKYIDDLQPEEVNLDIIEDDDERIRLLPDYGAYVVDSNIPHTLYEDFTHRRPAYFQLKSERIDVRDWKDVLVITCELLYRMDMKLFESFISDPSMNGKKVTYFSEIETGMRSPRKLDDSDIYIETHMSANGVRNLISKMLRRYGIRPNDFTIYLRADYTALHE